MKRMCPTVFPVLLTVALLIPLTAALLRFFGCSLLFTRGDLFAAAIMLISVIAAVSTMLAKDRAACGRPCGVMIALLPPLALLDLLLFAINCGAMAAVCMFVCFLSCCALSAHSGQPQALRKIILALSVLLIVPVCFLAVTVHTVGSILGEETVVMTITSPDGMYRAEVTDDDQGALGGSTVVSVCENGGLDFFFFKVAHSPERVYTGKWREYENMDIYWESGRCLVINSEKYYIE